MKTKYMIIGLFAIASLLCAQYIQQIEPNTHKSKGHYLLLMNEVKQHGHISGDSYSTSQGFETVPYMFDTITDVRNFLGDGPFAKSKNDVIGLYDISAAPEISVTYKVETVITPAHVEETKKEVPHWEIK